MIDNPLPDQVMQEKDALYVNEKYEDRLKYFLKK